MTELSLTSGDNPVRNNRQAEEESLPPVQAFSSEPEGTGSAHPHGGKVVTLRSRIAKAETEAILGALENTDWNRKRAAQLLAISYRGLLYKIRRHNIIRAK